MQVVGFVLSHVIDSQSRLIVQSDVAIGHCQDYTRRERGRN